MSKTDNWRIGQVVVVKTKRLVDAKYAGMSKSGKRVGVNHDNVFPFGCGRVVDWFSPENVDLK